MKIINCLFRQFRKITTFIIFLLFLTINLNAQSQKITLPKEQKTIRAAFEEIEKQTNFTVAYNESLIDVNKTFADEIKDIALNDALKVILKNTGLTFKIQGKQILIVKDTPQSTPRQYKGIILDETGEPIIGASVSVKSNPSAGTMTDIDGSFTLNAPAGSTLVVSYVGFVPQEIALNENKTTLDIELKEDSKLLDEVVVTALGIKREDKSLTYNVQKLDTDKLLNVKEASVPNALAGKVAGVTINQGASGIGGSTKVVMRGNKSVSDGGNNNALYVLDGIPLPAMLPRRGSTSNGQYGGVDEGDGISSLNMEDFEDVTVLTGPSAAALYGGQAANGVIMLTSKQGGLKEGKPRITFSHYSDFYSPMILPELQNSYGSRIGEFSSWGPKLENEANYDPADFFETGMSFSNSVGIQFGSEKYKTYLSFATYNADGVIHNNSMDRYNVTYNGMYNITDKLTLGATFMYSNKKTQNMLSQGEYYNPLLPVYLFPRGDNIKKYESFERYNADRGFATQFWPYDNQRNMQNPYWITRRNFNTYKDNRVILGANLKYTFNDWINASARYRFDRNTKLNEIKNYASTLLLLTSDSDKGSYLRATDENQSYYADIMVSFQKNIADWGFVVNAGASLVNAKNTYTANSNKLEFGAPIATVPNKFVLNNLRPEPQFQDGGQYENQALFISASFDYKRAIFLDVTARNEWTSLLANTNNESYFYPSVGLSTILTEWIKVPENILTFSKLRASYAKVGNVPFHLIGVTQKSYPINPGGGVSINSDLPISDLKFEKTTSYEIGLASRFLNGKLGFDFTYYNSNTYDQLFKFVAPVGSGYENYLVNAGKVGNHGIELSVDADLKFGDFEYSPLLTFTYNKNKIKELVKGKPSPLNPNEIINKDRIEPQAGLASFRNYLDVGGSVGDMYVNSFKKDGNGYTFVDPNTMQMLVDNQDLIYAGNANPDYSIGFNNSLSYKGFSLTFLIDARIGGNVVSATQGVLDSYGVSKRSAEARDNGGVPVNGVMMDAETYYDQAGGGAGVLSNYVYDATNIRLREASLSYRFKKPLIHGIVKNLTISVTGRNLFMIYNKAPFDPQLTSSVGTFYQGIDYFLMPSLRSFGLNVRFTL